MATVIRRDNAATRVCYELPRPVSTGAGSLAIRECPLADVDRFAATIHRVEMLTRRLSRRAFARRKLRDTP